METRRLRTVVLRDPRGSHWDGQVVERCGAGETLERGISPGEVGVFVLTKRTEAVTLTEQLRHGVRTREVEAPVYRRERTRFYKT